MNNTKLDIDPDMLIQRFIDLTKVESIFMEARNAIIKEIKDLTAGGHMSGMSGGKAGAIAAAIEQTGENINQQQAKILKLKEFLNTKITSMGYIGKLTSALQAATEQVDATTSAANKLNK